MINSRMDVSRASTPQPTTRCKGLGGDGTPEPKAPSPAAPGMTRLILLEMAERQTEYTHKRGGGPSRLM